MRNSFIITYDICDDKRLRKVFKIMKNWGDHLQYSVFECQLTRQELVDLQEELTEVIDGIQDQVLFIDLGPAEGRGERVIHAIGQPYVTFEAPCYIV